MVNAAGHFAMALLGSSFAWILWDGRTSLAFIGFALSAAMLPDVDLLLRLVLPVEHHGVTHTIAFVTIVAIGAGTLAEYGLRSRIERVWLKKSGYTAARGSLFLFVVSGILVGAYSHLFADMLSAPDIAKPLSPFWPLFKKPWSFDLIYYGSPWWNAGLLSVALALHAVLAYFDLRLNHPYQIRRDSRE